MEYIVFCILDDKRSLSTVLTERNLLKLYLEHLYFYYLRDKTIK